MDKKNRRSNEANVEDGIPEARYTRFGERIRQAIPGPMQCSVGCGGRNCKWENPARWSDADQAVKGVFSSWVLEDVVAMSRPSTGIIKKYKIIEQFKQHNICSIINLQRPGEHASCGPPLDKESLFTYRPQEFMDNDIFFYNFGWKDYGVTSLHTILDMVKVMSFALEEGRVAVHCHAGLGRTGVLIACYLVYAERMDPASAILRVRKKRSNSIQTRGQIACINEFWQFLRPLRIVFPQVVPHSKRLTLKQFLIRQRHILHGFESRELRHTPKLLHVICKRLSQIASGDVEEAMNGSQVVMEISMKRCNTVADIKETIPGAFVNENTDEEDEAQTLEVSSNSQTDIDAVLSPRFSRKESGRSAASSDGRPLSAGDLPNCGDENIVLTQLHEHSRINHEHSNTSVISDTSLEAKISKQEIVSKSMGDIDDLMQGTNHSNLMSTQHDIAKCKLQLDVDSETNEEEVDDGFLDEDEQIARDVDEILDIRQECNKNNNHSIDDTTTPNISCTVKPGAADDCQRQQNDKVEDDSDCLVMKSSDGVKSIIMPQISAIDNFIISDGDVMPQRASAARKMKFSAGRSDTILPTGSPTKNPRSSAKARAPDANIINSNRDSRNDGLAAQEICDADKTGSSPSGIILTHMENLLSNDVCVNLKNDSCQASSSLEAFSIDAIDVDESNKSDENVVKCSTVSSIKFKPMFTLDYTCIPVMAHEEDAASSTSSTSNLNLTRVSSTSSVNEDALLMQGYDVINQGVEMAKNFVESESTLLNDNFNDAQSNPIEIQQKDIDDDDLDEIINIVDDDSITDTENEDGDGRLSNSVASRVSWQHMNGKGGANNDENVDRLVSASSRHSGRRTPLMYRGGKNMELIEGENDDQKMDEKPESGSEDDDEFCDENFQELSFDGCDELSQRTDDVHDPGLLGNKLISGPTIPRINATKSLNDLAAESHNEPQLSLSRCSSSGDMRHPTPRATLQIAKRDPINVALALAYKLTDDEWLWEKVYTRQLEINNHKDAWSMVSGDVDAYLLSSLMWSWVEYLAEPVLTHADAQQMLDIIKRADVVNPCDIVDTFEKALTSLDPAVSNTIKCLHSCIMTFPTLPRKVARSLVRRTVAAITQTASTTTSPTIDENLENEFQNYINAKYEMNDRKRFFDDKKSVEREESVPGISECFHENPQLITNDDEMMASAGSIRSSGSSNTGSVVMSVPRIVVN